MFRSFPLSCPYTLYFMQSQKSDSQIKQQKCFHLHQLLAWIVLLEKVIAVYSDVFIVLVFKTSHVSWAFRPVPCILVNGDHIRDLGLPVYNVGIVVGIWYWKEYLRKTETKKDSVPFATWNFRYIYLSKMNLRSDRGHQDSSKIRETATAFSFPHSKLSLRQWKNTKS